jgi:DNA-binding Lrp family transcriptional regulator
MLDDTDKRILAALQRDAHLTADKLGEVVNLSPSQAGRRRQRLEALGIIEGYRARLSASRLGLMVQAFVQVQMSTHSPQEVRTFTKLVERRPEVTSAWTLTGEADYLLRIYCDDLASLHTLIHDVILPHPAVARVQSQIVMEQFKADAPLPT